MAVAWYWTRAELRRRWPAWLAVGLLIGLGGGLAMGALAGARRTQGAHPAFQAWADPPDLVVDPDFDRASSQPFLDALVDVPGVADRSDARAVALAQVVDGTLDLGSVGAVVASVDGERYFTHDRVLVQDGRMPDPTRADEVLVSESVAIEGIAVGDRMELRALDFREVFAAFESGATVPSDAGEPVVVEVTGIGTFPEMAAVEPEDAQDRTLVTPALYAQLPASSHLWDRTGIHLADGADPTAVRRAIQDLAADLGGTALFEVRADIDARAQRAVRPSVLALTGVGLAGAVFVAMLALQLLRRLGSEAEADHRILRMLATDRPTSRLVHVLPAAVTAGIAAVVAVAVAIAVNARTPVGPVRRLGAVSGSTVDGAVLVPGLVLLALVAVAPGLLAARSGARGTPREGVVVPWVQQVGAPLTAVLGIGGATGGAGLQRRSVARSGIASVALAIGMVVAVATFSSSLARLLDRPEMHGWNANVALVGQDGYGTFDLRSAASVDGVASLTGAVFGSFTIGERDVAGLGIVPLRGTWFPPVLEGRVPEGPDEVLLGDRTLEALGADIGQQVDVRLPDGAARSLRIAGTALFPGIGQLDNDRPTLGDGALVVLPDSMIEEIGMGWSALFADLEPGVDRDDVVADLVVAADELVGETDVIDVARPADIDALARLGFVPSMLLGLFTLVAAASLVHVLLVAARSRRRERAVLAVLGASPAQLRSVARWHAAVVVALAAAVSVPLGTALGRWAWRTLASEIGVVPDPVLPLPVIAGVLTGLLLIAGVAVVVPERRYATGHPADHLRSE
jgi:hypothetical protein